VLVAVSDIPEGGADLVAQNIAAAAATVPTVALGGNLEAKNTDDTTAADATQTGLQIARPYPLYTTSLTHLEHGFLDSARLTAWQYVIIDGGSPHAVAETRCKESTVSVCYAALYGISYAEEMVRTIGEAELVPQVATADYELRILRAPSLSLLAVWLHGPTDLLLPINPTPAKLKPLVPITEVELIAALKPLAEIRKKISDRG
jgi:hypothetical protein